MSQGLYAIESMPDSVWHWVVDSDLRRMPRGKKEYDYLYSDMGYYLFFRLAEKLLGEPVDRFLDKTLYRPLGLRTLGYLPLEKTQGRADCPH